MSGRDDESRGDGAALALIVVLALCVVGAIVYVHRHPIAEPGMAPADGGVIVAGGSSSGFVAGSSGERKAMAEQPLEQARALPRETFAPAVAHVTESDTCKSLRLARDRARENLRKRQSEWEAAELQREITRISDQGTERGCWTGGAG